MSFSFLFRRSWLCEESYDSIFVGFEVQDNSSRPISLGLDRIEDMEGNDPWTPFTRHDSSHGDLQVCQAKDRQLRSCPLPTSNRASCSTRSRACSSSRLRATTAWMGQTIWCSRSRLQCLLVKLLANEWSELIYLFMTANVFQSLRKNKF